MLEEERARIAHDLHDDLAQLAGRNAIGPGEFAFRAYTFGTE